MEINEQLIHDTRMLLLTKYKRFASELSGAKILYRTDLKYHTAATDGKNIYFDPNYLASLSEDDRIFLIAHELMHIKFRHMFRLEKDGKRKDRDVWNYVTDAIINANLQRDGFKIKEGCVNRPEALNYTAEEFYDIVIKEKENQEKNKSSGNSGGSNDFDGSEKYNENFKGDDHSLWEEAFRENQQEKEGQDTTSSNQEETSSFDEKSEFEKNREERKASALENYNKLKEKFFEDADKNASENINLGEVGSENNAIAWELLLRREIEKTETVWSNRRSIAENNYAYRLEENDIEEDAATEVMIDVSGSVSLDMVKSFLRILKSLLKHSKLKVGCFNASFWGMIEINSEKDIDNFSIPAEARRNSYAWTEDWDLAVRSFTKKREVNKIVYTDGVPGPGNMPKEDLKNENIIWIVYGNEDFKPCCGKVIYVPENQLKKLNVTYVQDDYINKTKK